MALGVILDLDQTIVDSMCAANLRDSRRIDWQEVYKLIPKFTVYDGIARLIADLRDRGVGICIVTSSPRPYCERVLRHSEIEVAHTVCYHDVPRGQSKPHPAPIVLGLQRLGITPLEGIAVGDHPKDIIAAKAAGTMAVGATWGCADRQSIIDAQPDAICDSVDELRLLILSRVPKAG
jgi:HAD superfamily hydrolase (TIGR01509 family)